VDRGKSTVWIIKHKYDMRNIERISRAKVYFSTKSYKQNCFLGKAMVRSSALELSNDTIIMDFVEELVVIQEK